MLQNPADPHVVGVHAFRQQAVVLYAGPLANLHLGDGIGQVADIVGADKGFNHRSAGIRRRVNQRARIRNPRLLAPGGEIHNVHHAGVCPRRYRNNRAVPHEGGVQRSKAVILRRGQAAQYSIAGVQGVRQRSDSQPARLGSGYAVRQRRRKHAVHHHERAPVVPPGSGGPHVGQRQANVFHAQLMPESKGFPRDGSGIGVLPGLVAPARRGQPQLLKGVPTPRPQTP